MAWYDTNDEAVVVNSFQNNLKIGTTSIGHLLKNYSVSKIKQVANAETNAAGQIIYDKIPGWTYKIQLEFLPLTQAQLTGLAGLFNNYEVAVTFYNPFTGTTVPAYQMYPNDQTAGLMYYYTQGSGTRIIYNGISLNLIGISPIS